MWKTCIQKDLLSLQEKEILAPVKQGIEAVSLLLKTTASSLYLGHVCKTISTNTIPELSNNISLLFCFENFEKRASLLQSKDNYLLNFGFSHIDNQWIIEPLYSCLNKKTKEINIGTFFPPLDPKTKKLFFDRIMENTALSLSSIHMAQKAYDTKNIITINRNKKESYQVCLSHPVSFYEISETVFYKLYKNKVINQSTMLQERKTQISKP